MHACVVNFDILRGVEIRNRECASVCVCVDRRLFLQRLYCSSFGRSNGWTVDSRWLAHRMQLDWRESVERKRDYIAVHRFIEWYRRNACKTLPFHYKCLRCRAPRRVFFFSALQYEHTADFMRYWLRLACCSSVCANTAFRCTLCIYMGSYDVWVRVQARSELHSSRIAWLTGWLVAVSIHTHTFGCLCKCVCVALSLANRHASNRNSKNYDMRLVDCELLCRNHTHCSSAFWFFSLIDPKCKNLEIKE